jgi:hypothetical protein
LALNEEVDRVRLDPKRVRADIDDAIAESARLRRIIALVRAVSEAMHAAPPQRGPYR